MLILLIGLKKSDDFTQNLNNLRKQDLQKGNETKIRLTVTGTSSRMIESTKSKYCVTL